MQKATVILLRDLLPLLERSTTGEYKFEWYTPKEKERLKRRIKSAIKRLSSKLIIMLAVIFFNGKALAQCDQATTWVFTIVPGYARTGATIGMEAGLWPVNSRFGVMAGPLMYSWQEVNKGKTETITDLDVSGRLVFKLTELGNNSPQMFTLFCTVRGNLGASYRGYISFGEFSLLGVEPFYGTKTGIGANIIFTTRL